MRFAFRAIPDPSQASARARPIVDVVVEGVDMAPQACLLDSGATAVRFGMHVAEMCGVSLSGSPQQRIAVGGALVEARMAEVSLLVSDGGNAHSWEAPVWFCDPWVPAFGLLGLTGFFDHFKVTFDSYEERVELEPLAAGRLAQLKRG